MALTVRAFHPQFVAEIGGVDLRDDLDQKTIEEIEAAIGRYAVVIFHDQPFEDEQQIGFARRLGTLIVASKRHRAGSKHRLPYPNLNDISNLDETNSIFKRDDQRRLSNLGNRLWHTDSSFQLPSGKYSMLSARVIPPIGGETEYADLRTAYDSLPSDLKEQLEGLTAEHSLMHSRAMLGFTDFTPEERAALPPVVQPVVRIHPESQRKTLYLASHASHIIDWPIPEGRILLHDLIEFATQPQFVYRHHWRVGDFVIYDNRCTMHRGLPYADQEVVRELRRNTTRDQSRV
jgi:alpha-ketoglutarate-dependent 2,4-dichlorophenoxyacetate dioxygenase